MPPLRVAPPVTLADMGARRLQSLCEAAGFDVAQMRASTDLFRSMAVSWGRLPVSRGPRWTSDITDDHTPFEFSVALSDGAPEIRFLIEVQGERPSIQANWDAAKAMNGLLARDVGAHLGRLEAIEDLFAPTGDGCRFAMWHAVCLRPSGPPDIKVYLNPQVHGRARARATTEEAMARLGFKSASEHLPQLDRDDEICYFSLDLAARPDARVKVYTAHRNATLARIKAAISEARGFESRCVREFCEAISGSSGPYTARPVLTCLSFVEGRTQPTTGTVHFPVRSYANDDAIVRERVIRYLDDQSAVAYATTLAAFADRHLADGIGMQTYVSLRLEREHKRLTVYLAPEAFEIGQAVLSQAKVSGVLTRPVHSETWLDAVGGKER